MTSIGNEHFSFTIYLYTHTILIFQTVILTIFSSFPFSAVLLFNFFSFSLSLSQTPYVMKCERFAYTNLSTDIQHKCNMLAVEKYTSKLFQRSHTNGPNSHLQLNN